MQKPPLSNQNLKKYLVLEHYTTKYDVKFYNTWHVGGGGR